MLKDILTIAGSVGGLIGLLVLPFQPPIGTWRAARSERVARHRLDTLRRMLEVEPPTLTQSLAEIICFLPIPIALALLVGSAWFAVDTSFRVFQFKPHRLAEPYRTIVGTGILVVVLGGLYYLYARTVRLAIIGYLIMRRVKRGPDYKENCKSEVREMITAIESKYPKLRFPPDSNK